VGSKNKSQGQEGLTWKPFGAIGCGIALWLSGFDQKWFGLGPWSRQLPEGYPPEPKEFLLGVVLTGLALAWCFASLRSPSVFAKIIGWLGFAYFYLHIVTLGYMADPNLFIWKFFPHAS
jgi:hypothetical protein